ncbi:hypothetical protein [Hugenholtzia roseola]|uniref:hypothetical protein n=1 Tax=Hugenholtzia roseola TaxID=1002 RepID=UPI000426A1D3|nr:hypothetical protein [Hugenholtzia roseola]
MQTSFFPSYIPIQMVNSGKEISKNEANKLENFIKYVQERIVDLTNLEIKTIVGEFDVTVDNEIAPRQGEDFKVMNSRINLIDGDITTHISNDLVYDKYEWLRNFHAHKEERGHEIINSNIQAIMSLIELFKKTNQEQKK